MPTLPTFDPIAFLSEYRSVDRIYDERVQAARTHPRLRAALELNLLWHFAHPSLVVEIFGGEAQDYTFPFSRLAPHVFERLLSLVERDAELLRVLSNITFGLNWGCHKQFNVKMARWRVEALNRQA